jgi:AcrR family transcriptional regulator
MVDVNIVGEERGSWNGGTGETPGLRERKKRRTRELIVDTAWRLFIARGFDGVSVAEVARAAEVSEATVFNYFPAKEDLVYARLASFEDELLAALRERPRGQSIVVAFGQFVAEPRGLLASNTEPLGPTIATVTRLIVGSRALLARERELWDEYTANLATLIAEEGGLPQGDVLACVVANALIGTQRALVDDVRRQVLAGVSAKTIARRVRARARQAITLLERGLDPAAMSA